MSKLGDDVTSWLTKNQDVLTGDAVSKVQHCAKQFGQLTLRHEFPKMKTKAEKSKASQVKMDSEVLEAETKFRSMDFKELLTHLWLEVNSKDNSTGFKKNGVRAFLSRQYPDLVKDFKPAQKSKKEKGKGKGKSRASSRGGSQSSRGSRTSFRSRANSQGSDTSRRSASVTFVGKGGGGKGKGKGKGKAGKRDKTPKPPKK